MPLCFCVPIGVECSQQRQWRRPHNHNHKIMVADFIYILLFLFPSSANGSPDDACNHREDESHRVMGWSHNVSAFYNNTLSLSSSRASAYSEILRFLFQLDTYAELGKMSNHCGAWKLWNPGFGREWKMVKQEWKWNWVVGVRRQTAE